MRGERARERPVSIVLHAGDRTSVGIRFYSAVVRAGIEWGGGIVEMTDDNNLICQDIGSIINVKQ